MRAVDEADASSGAEVAVIGVTDIRSVVGAGFDRRVEQVTDVREEAPLGAGTLDAEVAETAAPVLVVGRHDVGIPPGYAPPAASWCPTETTADYEVFVRRDGVSACPLEPGVGG